MPDGGIALYFTANARHQTRNGSARNGSVVF